MTQCTKCGGIDIAMILYGLPSDELLNSKKVKEKKFGEFYETEFALRQKQKQFLQYRGFYQDHIEYAVSANESS